jgi:hypothetical protein
VSGFEPLGRGDFVRLAWRLGRARATGVLTLCHGDARETLVLRRGHLMTAAIDPLGRRAAARLAQIAALPHALASFDGGTAAYPPGAVERQLGLAAWARRHLEAQVDAGMAQRIVAELAGARLAVRAELGPDRQLCDPTDLRILEAMKLPRRLDQIWPLARTPRFRLITFLHFLRSVGALALHGVAAVEHAPVAAPPSDAHRLLGIGAGADREAVKRAYRRLARALHPDLHPDATDERRRALARTLAEVTDAYRRLVDGPSALV